MEEAMNSYVFEAIQHDKKFPAKIFVTSIGESSYHWHYDYELMLVLKGSVILNIWPESCLVREGNIVLLNSKVVHGLKETNEENICLFIQLKQELFENRKDKNQNYRFHLNSVTDTVTPKAPYTRFIRTAALIGIEYNGSNMTNFYRIQALLYTLIADLFEYVHYDIRQYADNTTTVEESNTLLQIIEFVEQNYYEEMITEKLCHYIGMSEKTLYRFLKAHTNSTLKDLVISTKIEKTLSLLSKTDKPISVIAQECGFGTDKTFYRIFKKEVGVTPTEFRQNGSKIENNKQVQGYLDYNKQEAMSLLIHYL